MSLQLGQSQSNKLVQTQGLSQTLINSQKLMSLPLLDFEERIKEEVLENPALELEEDDSSLSLDEELAKSTDERSIPGEIFHSSSEFPFENIESDAGGLNEYLLSQINILDWDAHSKKIAEELTTTLDSNGFLVEDIDALYDNEKDRAIAHLLLPTLRQLSPVGCYCSNSYESLLEQTLLDIESGHPVPEFTVAFLRFCMSMKPELQKHKKVESYVQEKLGIAHDDLEAVFIYLRNLIEFPGQLHNKMKAGFITPDIVVEREGDKLIAHLNGRSILKVSPDYKKLLNQNEKDNTQIYLRNITNKAERFCQEVEMCNKTIKRVADQIVIRQRKYFLSGKKSDLQPLHLNDIGKDIAYVDSTISRATRGKYLRCEWGLFELKFFFSGSSGKDGKTQYAITEEIKTIVKNYNGRKKLSALMISEALEKKGISIARRTVSKYINNLEM